MSKTLDTLGPLASDVATAAGALEIMTGRRGLVPPAGDWVGAPLLRLAVPTGWGDDLAPEAAGPWRDAAGGLPRIPFPPLAELRSAGATILRFEAAAVHREWLARSPEKYGADVRELLLAAQDVSQEQYAAALELAAGPSIRTMRPRRAARATHL